MIQRKQTLYLLAALALIVLQLFMPVSTLVYAIQEAGQSVGETTRLMAFYVDSPSGNLSSPISIYYGLMLAIAGVLAAIAVFLFKNRPLQMRFAMFSLLLALIAAGLEIYYIGHTVSVVKGIAVDYANKFSAATFFPILDILLLARAHRLILKDEVLVKANERFR